MQETSVITRARLVAKRGPREMPRGWTAPGGSGALVPILVAGLAAVLLGGCGTNVAQDAVEQALRGGIVFRVDDSAGRPVSGATVYLVPFASVDTDLILGGDILTGDAEDRDEPLEDAIRRFGASFQRAVTNAQGTALIQPVIPGRYFRFVQPGPGDEEHLPGGSDCRLALDFTVVLDTEIEITLSSQPSSTAAYRGSTTCLGCHSEYESIKTHAHRLGFAATGNFTDLQSPADHPEYTDGWDRFLPAAIYTGGTVVWYSDYDSGRGFDKFVTTLTDPTPDGGVVFVKAYLWRDTTDQDKFKITLENVITPGDLRSPWTLEVPLSYGGAIYKQRYLVAVPGREGHYPLLQYQTSGDDARYDRTRRVYRDYHLDWFWNGSTSLFVDPPVDKTFEGNCTACHSTGFTRFQDAGTGEWLSGAVSDANGAFDLDEDGQPDELNLGCEVCHGPGSDHVNWVISPDEAGTPSRYIVTPQNLSPSREMMICGRCHDRPEGNWDLNSGEPLNVDREMPPPGISRSDYLAEYASRGGPSLSSYWTDETHSRSHRQQYSDMLKSPMHRNGRILTVCSDCHDSHGRGEFENQLKYDPADPESLLCYNCHIIEVDAHSLEKTGFAHGAVGTINCVACHQPKTAKSGAGTLGKTKGTPTGDPSDADLIYWENDITAHHFVFVPGKDHPDVDGRVPGSAMPIPYTNSCGTCHNLDTIQTPKPSLFPWALEHVPQEDD